MRPYLLQASVPMSDFSCGLSYSLCRSHSSCFRAAVSRGEVSKLRDRASAVSLDTCDAQLIAN